MPDRIAAQIVTGIGFLGAGAIMRSGLSVHGMTTAATIWVNAAIGMAAGAGEYAMATVSTTITLLVLVVLPPIEAFFARRSKVS
jgi:putative Mg2+ transporter-C (MgtC) family protein